MTDTPDEFPESKKEHFATNKDPYRSIAGRTDDRLHGLELAFDVAGDATILDIGCHDGRVAERFAEAGAAHIDGLDISETFIGKAADRLRNSPTTTRFLVADLSVGRTALEGIGLRRSYHLVCYLGVHHHLKKQMHAAALSELEQNIFALASDQLAVRTPQVHFDLLLPAILAAGFEPITGFIKGNIAPLRHFRRSV